MNAKNMFYKEGFNFSNAEEKAFSKEELVYNVTEDLLVILEDMGVSKKELARRLGKSRSYVSQILSGSRNMTLGSLSDICFVLGVKPEINLPVQEAVNWSIQTKKNKNDSSNKLGTVIPWGDTVSTIKSYSMPIKSANDGWHDFPKQLRVM